MVVFSASFKSLNIIAETLHRHGIQILRYDGRVSVDQRKFVEKRFEECDPHIPHECTRNIKATVKISPRTEQPTPSRDPKVLLGPVRGMISDEEDVATTIASSSPHRSARP